MNKIITGIKNLIAWLPLIWRDRDWDHDFFFQMLHFKLQRMERFFESDKTNIANSEKTARRIKYARILAGRHLANDYYDNAFMRHDQRWGEAEFIWKSYDSEHDELDIVRPNVKTKDDRERERDEYLRCMKHTQYMENQDIEELFRVMAKYVRCWWD